MSYLMPGEKLEEQLPKLIPAVLSLYKKHTETFYISKVSAGLRVATGGKGWETPPENISSQHRALSTHGPICPRHVAVPSGGSFGVGFSPSHFCPPSPRLWCHPAALRKGPSWLRSPNVPSFDSRASVRSWKPPLTSAAAAWMCSWTRSWALCTPR